MKPILHPPKKKGDAFLSQLFSLGTTNPINKTRGRAREVTNLPVGGGWMRGRSAFTSARRSIGNRFNMSTGEENKVKMSPKVTQMQQLLDPISGGDWNKCWEQGLTPWDLGQPTPVFLHLHSTGDLPKGRALIPGCGTGYDVVAVAGPERHVVGLEISEMAIRKSSQLFSSSPNAQHFTFLNADFFKWRPSELFDLVFDYTFFCAIEPAKRAEWAQRTGDLLKPNGELITLMFPIDDHVVGGPPYKVSVSDYEEVLHPLGFKAISIVDNELAVAARKGREKLGRWKRGLSISSL